MTRDTPHDDAEKAGSWRSTNFEFLRSEFPQLASYGAFAEMYLDDDADSAGVKLRRFVEAVVDAVYAHHQLPSPVINDLAARIQTRDFRRAVSDSAVLTDMDRIRREPGKAGAHHGHVVSKQSALAGLEAAHRVGIWFFNVFSKRSDTVPPFVRPPPGGARSGKNAELKRQLREGKQKLGWLVAELSVISPASIDGAEEGTGEAADAELAAYRANLCAGLKEKTATYWAPSAGEPFRVEISAADQGTRRLALVGGGGSGKTWQARRAALETSERATVIYAEAKYFNGDVDRWLDFAVAAYSSSATAARLARLTRRLTRTLVVVIDGLDEAASEHRSRLHEVAEALVHRCGAVVLTVGRHASQLPPGWAEGAVLCEPWSAEQLATLARRLAGTELPGELVRALRTPQDAALAARAAKLLGKGSLRRSTFLGGTSSRLSPLKIPTWRPSFWGVALRS
jgi:hypothetical protein